MKFSSYFKLSCEQFPRNHYDKIFGSGFNRIDLIKENAQCLFINKDLYSCLAIETSKQLSRFKNTGTINFEE